MATTALSPTGHAASLGASTWVVAKRVALRYLRTPQIMVLGTVQGVMFLLIFRYVFGGAIGSGALSYVNFLVPGFVTTGILFTGMGAATAVAEDLEQGFVDRLRSLPMPRTSVLAGRAIADTAMATWSAAISIAVGFAVGFRLHASAGQALEAFALLIAFVFAFEWLFVLLGMLARNAQAAQGMALLVFPLTFISSAYAPVQTMPGWMQAIASRQPVTLMVDAVRALTQGEAAQAVLGHPASYYVTRSLLWSLVLVLVFAPLAVARFRRG
jgi:ABC transporter DrrB family efflux protein